MKYNLIKNNNFTIRIKLKLFVPKIPGNRKRQEVPCQDSQEHFVTQQNFFSAWWLHSWNVWLPVGAGCHFPSTPRAPGACWKIRLWEIRNHVCQLDRACFSYCSPSAWLPHRVAIRDELWHRHGHLGLLQQSTFSTISKMTNYWNCSGRTTMTVKQTSVPLSALLVMF